MCPDVFSTDMVHTGSSRVINPVATKYCVSACHVSWWLLVTPKDIVYKPVTPISFSEYIEVKYLYFQWKVFDIAGS